MHRGERDKKTTFPQFGKINFMSMAIMCDQGHSHKPWGLIKEANIIWATSPERNYASKFCKTFARKAANTYLLKKSRIKMAPEVKKWTGAQSRQLASDLVPEFAKIFDFEQALTNQFAALRTKCEGRDRQSSDVVIDGCPVWRTDEWTD